MTNKLKFPDHSKLVNRIHIEGTLVLLTRLRIGMSSDEMDNRLALLRVKTLVNGEIKRIPAIPASSLKGIVRSEFLRIARVYYGDDKGTIVTDRLFGSMKKKSECKGFVKFMDAFQLNSTTSNFQTSTAIDPKSRTVKKRNIFAVEYLPPGTEFNFEMQIENIQLESDQFLILKHILNDIARGRLAIGGMKTRGMGLVCIKEMKGYNYVKSGHFLGLETPEQIGLVEK